MYKNDVEELCGWILLIVFRGLYEVKLESILWFTLLLLQQFNDKDILWSIQTFKTIMRKNALFRLYQQFFPQISLLCLQSHIRLKIYKFLDFFDIMTVTHNWSSEIIFFFTRLTKYENGAKKPNIGNCLPFRGAFIKWPTDLGQALESFISPSMKFVLCKQAFLRV